MSETDLVQLTRECDAIAIPAGTKMTLAKGSEVRITQSLGGTFTVSTGYGLARVDGKDADALGKEPLDEPATPDEADGGAREGGDEDIEKLVWEQLKTVYDPEIPVNIVDLGLVYLCRVLPFGEEGKKVEVTMTLTAPGCGMGDVLRADAEGKIASVPGVSLAEVKMVVEPPWNPSMMTEGARLQLGMM